MRASGHATTIFGAVVAASGHQMGSLRKHQWSDDCRSTSPADPSFRAKAAGGFFGRGLAERRFVHPGGTIHATPTQPTGEAVFTYEVTAVAYHPLAGKLALGAEDRPPLHMRPGADASDSCDRAAINAPSVRLMT